MKKLFIVFLTVITANITTHAQTAIFGAKAGYNAAYMSGYNDMLLALKNIANENPTGSTEIKSGFHLGFVSQLNLSEYFFLQPELLYSMQGLKLDGSWTSNAQTKEEKTITTLHYLQLPVYLGCKLTPSAQSESTQASVIVGVGPYFSYGMGGKEKDEISGQKNDVFGDNGFLHRFDFGLSAMLGAQLFDNRLQITAGYDLGLIDLVNISDWKDKKEQSGLSSVCNRNFKASVTVFF